MRRVSARVLIGISIALLIVGAGALALAGRDRTQELPARKEAERPKLLLLTTLPLLFPEEFTLEGGGSEALTALETRYEVVPIGIADAASLDQARLLLMAHPLAQPAEALIDLDRWVRDGGSVLLLADPRLDWPSNLPLGDKLRPPPAFADTGLLWHWGLRLGAPEKAGLAQRRLAGRTVLASSPGALSGKCRIGDGGFVARCRIGNGRATIVADADILNVAELAGSKDNLDALLAELAALER